jgi:hypothetical protein
MTTVMNSSTTKTMPRNARLAASCGSSGLPPSVAVFSASTRKAGVMNGSVGVSAGSRELQSSTPIPNAAK